MTPRSTPWLDELVDDGTVQPPTTSNPATRDALMHAARTSLADAARDPARSPGGIIRDVENAVRQAITALIAHHGTRIATPNKHAAVVRIADAHPGSDDAALLLDAGTKIINRVAALINTGRPIPPPPGR